MAVAVTHERSTTMFRKRKKPDESPTRSFSAWVLNETPTKGVGTSKQNEYSAAVNGANQQGVLSSDGSSEPNLGWLRCVVKRGVEFEGELSIETPAVIDGTVLGKIKGSAPIFISTTGYVLGTIKAPVVSVAGRVDGTIEASERGEVKKGGIVKGAFSAPRLTVDEGAIVAAECTMMSAVMKQATVQSEVAA